LKTLVRQAADAVVHEKATHPRAYNSNRTLTSPPNCQICGLLANCSNWLRVSKWL
jgi:hypothetical protein